MSDISDKRSTHPGDYEQKLRRGQLKRSWQKGVASQRDGSKGVSIGSGLTWGSIGQLMGYLLGDVDEKEQDQLYEQMLTQFRLTDRGELIRHAESERLSLRVVTWNLRYSAEAHTRRRLGYLQSFDWDIALLQEVSKKAWRILSKADIVDAAIYPFAVHDIQRRSKRPHGAAILVRNGLEISRHNLIPGIPKAERAIHAVVSGLQQPVHMISWHAPNAAGEGRSVKMSAYASVTDFLRKLDGPTIIGFDGNHWNLRKKLTRASPADPASAWYQESSFFAAEPRHKLTDCFLDYLRDRPAHYQQLLKRRPDGPLATSFVRGSSKRPQPDRFDYIFASDHFETEYCSYEFTDATAAGSDHALVMADLRLEG